MPIFVNEFYAIKLTIENKEESLIENLTLTAEFQNINLTTNELESVASTDKSCNSKFDYLSKFNLNAN
jgi:hypothetical protein